ncbi:hypothetical protein SNEBB_006979 [Seison nebaliae]|nr:hypothetical protein SNEBB_006979 [Seison nebaliae]
MNMEDQRMLQQNGIEFVNNFQQNELSLNDFNENQQVQYSTENVYDTANVGNVPNGIRKVNYLPNLSLNNKRLNNCLKRN